MHAKRRPARDESKPTHRYGKALFIRQYGRKALVGACLLVIGGVGDSFRGEAKDSLFHPTLQLTYC